MKGIFYRGIFAALLYPLLQILFYGKRKILPLYGDVTYALAVLILIFCNTILVFLILRWLLRKSPPDYENLYLLFPCAMVVLLSVPLELFGYGAYFADYPAIDYFNFLTQFLVLPVGTAVLVAGITITLLHGPLVPKNSSKAPRK